MLGGLLFVVCVILQFHYQDAIPWVHLGPCTDCAVCCIRRTSDAICRSFEKELEGLFHAARSVAIFKIGSGIRTRFSFPDFFSIASTRTRSSVSTIGSLATSKLSP
jgi:hypothetical protein